MEMLYGLSNAKSTTGFLNVSFLFIFKNYFAWYIIKALKIAWFWSHFVNKFDIFDIIQEIFMCANNIITILSCLPVKYKLKHATNKNI